jgi:hypothetical protein
MSTARNAYPSGMPFNYPQHCGELFCEERSAIVSRDVAQELGAPWSRCIHLVMKMRVTE